MDSYAKIPSQKTVIGNFLNGPTPGSFLFIFVLFKYKLYRKNCTRQRDSNSGRQSRRQARLPLDHHHDPQPRHWFSLYNIYFMFDCMESKHTVVNLIKHFTQVVLTRKLPVLRLQGHKFFIGLFTGFVRPLDRQSGHAESYFCILKD